MARRAVESALETRAGQILVSDDCGGDDLGEQLADLADSRLRVVSHSSNLGLWRNHLWLINHSMLPWVKFLQHDDLIAPGGLAVLASHASEDVAIVSALPLYRDWETSEISPVFELAEPLSFTSDLYMRRLLVVGNELGTPSCTLIRRAALQTRPEYWRDDVSADFIMNVMAASRGRVVLLPPGSVYTGRHSGQDGQRQGTAKAARRLRNSVALLRKSGDPRVRAVGCLFGLSGSIGDVRALVGAHLRGSAVPVSAWQDTVSTFVASLRMDSVRNHRQLIRSLRLKWGRRRGLVVSEIRV